MANIDEVRVGDERLLCLLSDAACAALWSGVVLLIAAVLSWIAFLVTVRVQPATVWGVPFHIAGPIWIGALALIKVTAASFGATAFGLWMWRRRLAARLAASAG